MMTTKYSKFVVLLLLARCLQALKTSIFSRRNVFSSASLLIMPQVASAEEYTGTGYTFSYPSEFALASKPVKTHLDEVLVKQGKRQIGVVVDRVKLNRLEDFGDPNFVGERVVKSELGRDGVTDAQLLSADKIVKKDGVTYYYLEYTNASSRGDNHFLASVAVRNGLLYILTTSARIDDFSNAESVFRNTLSSFNLT